MTKIVIDKNFHPGGIKKREKNVFKPDIKRNTKLFLKESIFHSIPLVPPIRKKV